MVLGGLRNDVPTVCPSLILSKKKKKKRGLGKVENDFAHFLDHFLTFFTKNHFIASFVVELTM